MEETRSAAAVGGFGAVRAQALEALEKRLDQYCDDLVDTLHKGECEEPERVRAYLEIAARFMGLVKGPQTAQIVRRRAAAA
jgi:regulator of sigma D